MPLRHQSRTVKVFVPSLHRVVVVTQNVVVTSATNRSVGSNNHIAAFLDGHLAIEVVNFRILRILVHHGVTYYYAALTIATEHVGNKSVVSFGIAFDRIHLSQAVRICACIVRRKIVLPHGHTGKVEYRRKHTLHKRGIVQQKQRHGRIGNIRSGNTAVAVTLLGQEQQLSFGVFRYLVRAHGLTKGGYTQQTVVFVVVLQTFVQIGLELRQLFKCAFVIVVRLVYRVKNSLSVAEIVTFEPFAEVENGTQIVESHGHFAKQLFAADNVVVTVEADDIFFVVLYVSVIYRAIADKLVPIAFGKKIRLFCRNIPVAPIGGKTVACMRHGVLPVQSEKRSLVILHFKRSADDKVLYSVVAIGFA